MVKWLVSLLPFLACAQVPYEELSPQAIELLDTSSLNTISPVQLWQIFGVPKDMIYALSEYRKNFGGFEHEEELYYIPEIDSNTARYLIHLLPLERFREKQCIQIIAKTSTRSNKLRSTSSIRYHSREQRAALLCLTENNESLFSGFLQSEVASTSVLVGNFSIHCGEGLLFGQEGFNSTTTGEYFRSGLRGQSGTSTAGVFQGIGMEQRRGMHHFTLAAHTNELLYVWNATKDQIAYGIAGRGRNLTTFAKLSHGPLRAFTEFNNDAQRIGANVFFRDVLYEYILDHDEQFTARHYLSWRDYLGTWNLQLNSGEVRLNLQGKDFAFLLSQHENGTNQVQDTWRIRFRCPTIHSTYDIHWHSGTYGFSTKNSWRLKGVDFQVMTACIASNGHPVWLSVPTARGYIGALAVYDDFFGGAISLKSHGLSISTSFNVINPNKSALQLSYYRSL